ncbi:argininosuccinate synthase, partial [Candidatus Uhrbacteria bacterium]|nr:argininosuccinate synthase [Candidatus Uhrbacteria bacterium]
QADKPYSYDENMWGNTGEGGEIENPELIPPLENILQWCKPLTQTPNQEEILEIEFAQGVPKKLNGVGMKLSDLIKKCNTAGSAHGVGVFHLIEDRLVGLKVRGVYENPGASILIAAHKNLEKLVSTREENELKSFIDTKWAYLAYGAKWYDPVMYHIHAFTNSQNKKVTGKVKVRLYKGNIDVIAAQSPYSLFDQSLATFERSAAFNQNASAGFIEIYTLAQKTAYNVYDFENELNKN